MLALTTAAAAFMAPVTPAYKMGLSNSKVLMNGGKGFGGGEATRDPAPTAYDPNDPKGKQQAIHKAESFAEYLAKRGSGSISSPPPAAAAAPSAPAASGGSDILGTLSGLQGPEILWGPDGVLIGYEESDIKGYDTFGKFGAALAGVDLPNPCTVFAPPDEVVEEFIVNGGTLTPDIVKYHCVPGSIATSAFSSATLKTLQGESLTYRRMFRKDFIDDATPGVKSEGASKSASWPADVSCDNGVVHSCNQVLTPGWTPSS